MMKIVYEDVFGTQSPLILDVHGTIKEKKNSHNKTIKFVGFRPVDMLMTSIINI